MAQPLIISWILLMVVIANAKELLENSTGICEKCVCETTDGVFRLNCDVVDINYTLSEWPATDAIRIIASFSGTRIRRLGAMPSSDAQLQIIYSHCNISELATGLLENCVNATYLDLSYNLLEGVQLHSDVFKGPYNNTVFQPIALKQLNLAYNKIHTLDINLFEHLPNLVELNLEGNALSVWDRPSVMSFQKLTNLQRLNIANNKFVNISDDIFKPLSSLRKFDLSRNGLISVPQGIASIGATLEVLIIDSNPILSLTDESFLGLEKLVRLSANDLKSIKSIKSNAFASLDNLVTVELSGMNNTDGKLEIDDEAFGKIKNLRELNMSNSQLIRLPVNLVNWTELEVLDINGNIFKCECEIFNISSMLPDIIKNANNGPNCYDFRKGLQIKIFGVGVELCYHYARIPDSEETFSTMRIMRTSLLMLSILLVVTASVALWLARTKYLSYRRSKQYTTASHVVYNPITTNMNHM